MNKDMNRCMICGQEVESNEFMTCRKPYCRNSYKNLSRSLVEKDKEKKIGEQNEKDGNQNKSSTL
jgi:hypothetical protein